jgi:hypothetical protein
VPVASDPVEIATAAGTVRVAVAVFVVSATEVAVTVTVSAELEAAGAVKVTPVAVVFDSVPPPLTVQETPLLFESLVTVAVSVTASVGSTVEADDVTDTPTGFELPPQPDRVSAQSSVIKQAPIDAPMRPERTKPFQNMCSSEISTCEISMC